MPVMVKPSEILNAESLPALTPEPIQKKSQAQVDAELLASAEWVATIAEGEVAWQKAVNDLIDCIQALQTSGDHVALMICSEYFGVQMADPKELFEPLHAAKIVQSIEAQLSLAKYRTYMEERTRVAYNSYPRSVEFYVGEFATLRHHYLNGALGVFKHFDANAECMEGDLLTFNALSADLRPLSGGDGLAKWKGYTRKYAKEKLQGLRPLDFFGESLPRYIRNHFGTDIEMAGQLFVMQSVATINLLKDKFRPQSASAVGIEFENHLRETILEEFDNVVVETTPVTGDQGADLLIRIESIRIAIQAKRYTGVVGNAAVQEVYAAKQFYDADFAMVVTSSRYTNPARALADKLEVVLATSDDFIVKLRRLLS